MEFKPYKNQVYEQIKRQYRNSGRFFEDTEFPANENSLFRYNPPQGFSISQIEWLRPREICSNPRFSVDGFDAKDLNQGCVGDCWFIAGAVDVSTSNKYLETVVPQDQTFDSNDYAGVFHFRFWQFGDWIDVVVDDRLPTVNGKLCFCSNKKSPNEFWGPLLEKAYSKLAGCYEFIDGGFMQDALVDLTGGVSEYFDIPHEIKTKSKDSLWKSIIQSHQMGSLSGATVLPKHGERLEEKLSNGLIVRHAYSVTKVTEISADNQYFKIIKDIMGKIGGKDLSNIFKPVERPRIPQQTAASNFYQMPQPGIGFEAMVRSSNYVDDFDNLWNNNNNNDNNQYEDEYNPRGGGGGGGYDEDEVNPRDGYDDFRDNGDDEYNPRDGSDDNNKFKGESQEQGAPIRLLRLRNPWGNHDEWKGAWGDGSLEWRLINANVKSQLGLVYDHDGEFWMSFNDFVENFDFMCTVHVNLHAFQEQILSGRGSCSLYQWDCKQYHGEWEPGRSAGGSSEPSFWTNPQYLISVMSTGYGDRSDKATLIVSLMFKDGSKLREDNGGKIVGIPKLFRLFRVKRDSTENHRNSHVKFSGHELELVESSYELSQPREVSIRFRVTPGNYVIIPCTRSSNTPGRFLVRLFTETNIQVTEAALLDINEQSSFENMTGYSQFDNFFGHDYLSNDNSVQPFSNNYGGYAVFGSNYGGGYGNNLSVSPSFDNYQQYGNNNNSDLNCNIL